MVFLPRAPFPSNPEPQLLRLGRNDGDFQRRQHAIPIMQQHGAGILVPGLVPLSLGAQEGGYFLRYAEEEDALIDEVGAEVVDGAAAGFGAGFPGLGAGEGGFVAVEVGGEFDDAAERVGAEEVVQGEEVGIPAAVFFRERSVGWDWLGWLGLRMLGVG